MSKIIYRNASMEINSLLNAKGLAFEKIPKEHLEKLRDQLIEYENRSFVGKLELEIGDDVYIIDGIDEYGLFRGCVENALS